MDDVQRSPRTVRVVLTSVLTPSRVRHAGRDKIHIVEEVVGELGTDKRKSRCGVTGRWTLVYPRPLLQLGLQGKKTCERCFR